MIHNVHRYGAATDWDERAPRTASIARAPRTRASSSPTSGCPAPTASRRSVHSRRHQRQPRISGYPADTSGSRTRKMHGPNQQRRLDRYRKLDCVNRSGATTDGDHIRRNHDIHIRRLPQSFADNPRRISGRFANRPVPHQVTAEAGWQKVQAHRSRPANIPLVQGTCRDERRDVRVSTGNIPATARRPRRHPLAQPPPPRAT